MKMIKQQMQRHLLLACALSMISFSAQADVDNKSLDDYLNETESGELLPIFRPQLPQK